MSKKSELPTISLAIDSSSRSQPARHTVQPQPHAATNEMANRPRAQSYSNKTLVRVEPSIPEDDSEDEERVTVENERSTRTSFTKKVGSRTNSTAGSMAKKTSVFDKRSNGQFQRGFDDSTRSSAISLQVQREQYCCCSKWTQFERRLALSVLVLAAIIIGLAMTVGFLANDDDEGADEPFIWKP